MQRATVTSLATQNSRPHRVHDGTRHHRHARLPSPSMAMKTVIASIRSIPPSASIDRGNPRFPD